jgi:hypothetical protein
MQLIDLFSEYTFYVRADERRQVMQESLRP